MVRLPGGDLPPLGQRVWDRSTLDAPAPVAQRVLEYKRPPAAGVEMAKRTRDQYREPRFDGVLAASRAYGLPAVRTLSDEYRDIAEPEDSERVPPPEPPGLVRRIAARVEGLTHRVRG